MKKITARKLDLGQFRVDEWGAGVTGGFTPHRKCELPLLPLHGTRKLVDALRTGLHRGRELHSAPVRRRSESGAKRRQWSKAADHLLQADLPAAWWNSQPLDRRLLLWPEPPGWMIRVRCSRSAPRILVSCSARDGWRGWLASNPRTTVCWTRMKNSDVEERVLSSRPKASCSHIRAWASGAVLADRLENTSPLNDWRRCSTVRRGTSQSGAHQLQRDRVAHYGARRETLHDGKLYA